MLYSFCFACFPARRFVTDALALNPALAAPAGLFKQAPGLNLSGAGR